MTQLTGMKFQANRYPDISIVEHSSIKSLLHKNWIVIVIKEQGGYIVKIYDENKSFCGYVGDPVLGHTLAQISVECMQVGMSFTETCEQVLEMIGAAMAHVQKVTLAHG
jgi:hypothetical protein